MTFVSHAGCSDVRALSRPLRQHFGIHRQVNSTSAGPKRRVSRSPPRPLVHKITATFRDDVLTAPW